MTDLVVVGLGYVGLTSAVGLASLGHKVIGIDTNETTVAKLNSGQVPIYEPGLEDLMQNLLSNGNLSFYDSYEKILDSSEIAFVCVPTPSLSDGNANLAFVESAIESLASKLTPGSIVVIKSTVPIGTSLKFASDLQKFGIDICSNPEFLQEGSALYDFENPSRIVVGGESQNVSKKVMDLYEKVEAPRLYCNLTSAETIKHASNAFLALKLSFVNELASLCEITGARMSEVKLGLSLDPRIGDKFLDAGPGWGGSCFPKDTSELAHTSRSLGWKMLTVESAIESNKRAMQKVCLDLFENLKDGVSGKKIAVWGLAFKANTDDTRDSPAMTIIDILLEEGAVVTAFDPLAKPKTDGKFGLAESAIDACIGAHALLVLTEATEFRHISPSEAASAMAANALVFDTRRVLEREVWLKHFEGVKTLGN